MSTPNGSEARSIEARPRRCRRAPASFQRPPRRRRRRCSLPVCRMPPRRAAAPRVIRVEGAGNMLVARSGRTGGKLLLLSCWMREQFRSPIRINRSQDVLLFGPRTGLRTAWGSLGTVKSRGARAAGPASPRLNLAFQLDRPGVNGDTFVGFCLGIDAMPPGHVVFLCDKKPELREHAAAEADHWGFRGIADDAVRQHHPALYDTTSRWMKTLRNRTNDIYIISCSFAVER